MDNSLSPHRIPHLGDDNSPNKLLYCVQSQKPWARLGAWSVIQGLDEEAQIMPDREQRTGSHTSFSSHAKMALGSALASIGGLLIILSPLLGFYSIPHPWASLLGFVTGLLAGVGTALAIGGLIERRRERWLGG